jgi:alcohol dehydrogenase (NADP+)
MIELNKELLKNRVNPSDVPKIMLNNGECMPCIGFGTFGSDHVDGKGVGQVMQMALQLGYRQLDCARAYRNEPEIGEALMEVYRSGLLRREDLRITSKVWNDRHKEGEILISCAETLRDLRTDYLDLYLVHWPFPNSHAPGCDINARDPHSRPFLAEEYMMVWRQMEHLVDLGLVKSIGVSNMTIPKLNAVWDQMRIKPVVNEIEQHPHLQQPELFEYLEKKNVKIIGHTPLGNPHRPERDRIPEDTNIFEDKTIIDIAASHGVHPATIAIKWAVQRGTIPIPFSTSATHILSNLRCTIEDPLTDEEMQRISGINVENRLIKAHVLLWEGAPDWKAIWDMDGVIDTTGWTRD